MGVQLIIVVETNRKNKSDWMYIKTAIDHFYSYDRSEIKFSPVYMDSKNKYRDKNIENEIEKLIKTYSDAVKGNISKVIYCFDCDNYDTDSSDLQFIRNAENYCRKKGFDFVWFCKDIERVFLNKKVSRNKKQEEAAKFISKKMIQKVKTENLSANTYRNAASNVLSVLDKYLVRK